MFGVAEITRHYHHYPSICDQVEECETLIEETRKDYSKRKANYDAIRGNHLECLVKAYKKFENAEIDALFKRAELERQIAIKQKVITILNCIAVAGGIASIVSIPLALYFAWFNWEMHAGLERFPFSWHSRIR